MEDINTFNLIDHGYLSNSGNQYFKGVFLENFALVTNDIDDRIIPIQFPKRESKKNVLAIDTLGNLMPTGLAFEQTNGLVRPVSGYRDADFVFGSPTLNFSGDLHHENRFFFDKSKGSMMAGSGTDRMQPDSLGTNAFGFGKDLRITGDYAFAGGRNSEATGNYAFSVGYNSKASASYSVAAGYYATASGYGAFAGGYSSKAEGERSVALAQGYARGTNSVAIGPGQADTTYSVAIGNSTSSGYGATALGLSVANGDRSFAAGDAEANGDYAVALGQSTASGLQSFATGNSTAEGDFALASGESEVNGDYSIGMGKSYVPYSYGIAIGYLDSITSSYGVAIGYRTKAGNGSQALGYYTSAEGNYSSALGYYASAASPYSAALGYSAETNGSYAVSIGNASAGNDYTTAIGYNANAGGYRSQALGYYANAAGNQASALGNYANAGGQNASAMGYSAYAGGDYAVSLGNADALADYSVAIGSLGPDARSYGSIAFGRYNYSANPNITYNDSTWIESEPLFEIGNGYYSYPNNVYRNALTVLKNGNVGIGDHTPDYALDVVGDLYVSGNTRVGSTEYFFDGGSEEIGVYGDLRPYFDNVFDLGTSSYHWDDIYATNNVIQTSDLREKDHIQPLKYGLEEVLQLRPVSFTWKEQPEDGTRLGLIAQEVLPVIQEVVKTQDTNRDSETGELVTKSLDRLGMYYTELIPVLIKAVQEQQAIIERERAEKQALEARIERLEALVKALVEGK